MSLLIGRRMTPAFVAGCSFILLTCLYIVSRSTAAQALTIWGVTPFRFAFLDLDTILSALRCRRAGIDVFASNPCDALGRVFDYSPAWLIATGLPVTTDWLVPGGFVVDAAFIGSLCLLPEGRGRWQVAVLIACVVSPPVVFAMERANNDLIIFGLAASAAALAVRSFWWRALGYGCALLAGLLKYFPLLLLLLICRERLRVFAAVAACALLLLAGCIWVAFDDLHRALPLIPVGKYFGDMFGVSTLPLGLVYAWELPPYVAQFGLVGLVVLSLTAALSIGLDERVRADLAGLTVREEVFLLVGALLILGCFFTAQNIGYRAVHLLLAAPALTALATLSSRPVLYRVNVVVLLVLLWSEGWRHWLDAALTQRAPWQESAPIVGSTARLIAWGVREACWWWIVTLLAGLSFGTLIRSPVGRAVLPTLGRRLDHRAGASSGDGGSKQAAHLAIAP